MEVECASIADSVSRIREECEYYQWWTKPGKYLVVGAQEGDDGLSVHIGKNKC